jgi:hypothetical protein
VKRPIAPPVAVATPPAGAEPAKSASVSSALKDQLALVAIVVIFAGLRFIDAYYGTFGIQYSSLDLPLQYFLYLGVKAMFLSPFIGIAYLIAVLWLGVGETWAAQRWSAKRWWVALLSYVVVALVAAITYWAGHDEGVAQARRDMTATTSLPSVVLILGNDGKPLPYVHARVLLSTSDELVLYYKAKYGGYPVIIILPKGQINALQLRR